MTWKERGYTFRRKRKSKTHTQEMAGRLAPLEEQQGEGGPPQTAGANGQPAPRADDTILVSSANLKFPNRMIEEERQGADIFRLDFIVVVILAAALAFVAFIAWQITLMPAK